MSEHLLCSPDVHKHQTQTSLQRFRPIARPCLTLIREKPRKMGVVPPVPLLSIRQGSRLPHSLVFPGEPVFATKPRLLPSACDLSCSLVAVYGEGIPDGRRPIAFHLSARGPDGALRLR